jgi:hypothetical protein
LDRLPLRRFLAASLLTIGLGLCIAALAIGHADDAPGVGLIGFGAFLFFAFCAVALANRAGTD